MRLVLRSLSGGAVAGTLVKDVSLAAIASASPGAFDTTEDKIDHVLQRGLRPQLVYSDTWTNGVASLAIGLVPEVGAQTTLFTASAPADGTYAFKPVGEKGTRNAVRLHFYDSGANEIGDPFIAYYTGIVNPATFFLVR